MYLHRQEVVPIVVESGKGVTASQANRLLGRTGASFWQRESYDHAASIENNPVKARRGAGAGDFPWSSAREGKAAGAETSLGAAR